MQEFLIALSTQHVYWVYLIIIVLACAEGPVLSMIFGVLIKLGYFSFIPIYSALMLGDLIGDSLWYYVGYKWGHSFIRKFGKYVGVTEEAVEKVTRVFHNYKNRILITSKVSNGFGFALVTLITAGMIKIPFRIYISLNLVGQFVWTGILLGIGFFMGDLYTRVDGALRYVSITAIIVFILVLFNGYRKYLKRKMGGN